MREWVLLDCASPAPDHLSRRSRRAQAPIISFQQLLGSSLRFPTMVSRAKMRTRAVRMTTCASCCYQRARTRTPPSYRHPFRRRKEASFHRGSVWSCAQSGFDPSLPSSEWFNWRANVDKVAEAYFMSNSAQTSPFLMRAPRDFFGKCSYLASRPESDE